MNKIILKVLALVIVFLFVINNFFAFLISPIHSIINLILIFFIVYVSFEYGKKENYDYDAENPNALITGRNVANSVYASYPNQVGGLSWVL